MYKIGCMHVSNLHDIFLHTEESWICHTCTFIFLCSPLQFCIMSATYNTDKAALNHILAPTPNTNHCFLYYCPQLGLLSFAIRFNSYLFFFFSKTYGEVWVWAHVVICWVRRILVNGVRSFWPSLLMVQIVKRMLQC